MFQGIWFINKPLRLCEGEIFTFPNGWHACLFLEHHFIISCEWIISTILGCDYIFFRKCLFQTINLFVITARYPNPGPKALCARALSQSYTPNPLVRIVLISSSSRTTYAFSLKKRNMVLWTSLRQMDTSWPIYLTFCDFDFISLTSGTCS